MGKFDKYLGVRRDESGSLNALRRRVDDIENQQTATTGVTVSIPEVDATFSPLFDTSDKRGVYVTLAFFIPGDTEELAIVMVERSLIVNATAYAQKRIKPQLTGVIEDSHRSASPPRIEDRLDKRLKYSTQYDIIRLKATGANGSVITNPANTDFAGYPGNVLYTFTTPDRFGTPSGPNAGLIVYNQLDETSPDIYDAVVGLKVHAPVTLAGAAQTYGAAGVDWVEAHLTRAITGQPTQDLKFRVYLNDTELSQVDATSTPTNRGFVIIPCPKLIPGAQYTWVRNVIHTQQDKAKTDGSVAFRAANLQIDITQLTNTALQVSATDPNDDGKTVEVVLELTQPAQPVALRNHDLQRKKSAATAWREVTLNAGVVQSDIYHQLAYNAGTISGSTGTVVVTGVGTSFTKLRAGWKIKVGAQTLTIREDPTSDTSLNLTALPSSSFTGQAFSVVIAITLNEALKVKPSTSYNLQCILRARGGTKATISASFTTDADGNIVQDTTAPVIANPPNFKYSNGAFVCKLKHADVTQVASLSKVELSINNGTNSLNLDDLESDTVASGIVFYDIGNAFKMTVSVSRDRVHRTLGKSGTVKCAFRITNSVGVTTSSDSATLSLATLKDKSKRTNHQQRLLNPVFAYDDGAGNLGDWNEFNPNNNNFNLIQTASGRIRWETANARVWWRENTSGSGRRYLAQDLGITFIPGDKWACGFIVESDGSLTINFDFFLACTPTITGTADPDGTTTLTGTGTAFLTEIKAGDEITVNSETRTVQSISTDTSLLVTSAFSNTAGGATIFAVSPQSEIIQMGNQNLTAGSERQVEGIFTISANANTALPTAIFFRPNGTISTAGPYLFFTRPIFNLGETPAEFTYSPTQRADFDITVTGGGGIGQEGSGENPSSGGFEILLP